MRLKKIEMQGFKSFADRVTVDFTSPIVVIVGPNGCGKSNIVDAFKWVLGEQSAKSLRGDRMLDVIFSGTTKRRPVNFAEVIITFCDVQDDLPVDYEEVEICRRVYRNGDSEYLINRKACRLKDIQSLFWDTGLGKDAFSIFEQGKIDQVIQMTPIERKSIFEEASGILRFKLRKKETMGKLQSLDGNLDRIREIHRETAKTLRQLEKQSLHAQKFKDHKDEYSYLEKACLVEKWRFAHGQVKHLSEQLQDRSKRIEVLQRDVLKESERFSDWESHYNEKRNQLQQFDSEVQKISSSKRIEEVELENLGRRETDNDSRIKGLTKETEELDQKRKLSRNEFQEKHRLYEKLQKETELARKDWVEVKEGVDAIHLELDSLRGAQKNSQQRHLQALQEESSHQRKIQEINIKKEAEKKRIDAELYERKSLNAKIEDLESSLILTQTQWDDLNKSIDEKRLKLQGYDHSLQDAKGKRLKASDELANLIKDLSELKGRANALRKLKEGLEGISASAKRLLKESSLPQSSIYKKVHPLYELISSKKGYEQAFASLLRGYSQTLVVETIDDKELLLKFVNQNKLSDFSFICLEEAAMKPIPTGENSFVRFVSESPLAKHFTQNVSWVEDVFSSSVAAQMVSTEGFLKDSLSVYFFPIGERDNSFLREAEMQECEKLNIELSNKALKLKKNLNELQIEEEEFREKRLELDKVVRGLEMKLVETNFMLQRAKSEINEGRKKKALLDVSIQQLQEGVYEKEIAYKKTMELYEVLLEKTESLKNELKGSEKLVEEKSATYRIQQTVSEEKAGFFRLSQQKSQELLRFLDVFEVRDHEQERLLNSKVKERDELIIKQAELFRLKEEKQREKLRYEEEIKSINKSRESHQKIVDLEKKQESVFSEKQQELEGCLEDEKKSFRNFELKKVEFTAKESSFAEELKMHCGVSVEDTDILNMEISVSKEEAESRLKELKSWMDKSGAINMTAIEEFESVKERYGFIEEELDDLMKSKEELLQITKQLDQQSRKLFRQTFKEIQAHFRHNFSVLFGGGEADLTFTESHDILNAGIEITAKPPGKSMRSIQLLSGGEKCLTALALLFAIFSVRPAPFCILDEIDAPLDDVNTRRFTDLLKEYQEGTQFIVVTHNKHTMSIGDALCGVSMEEKGVSKLVTLCLENHEKEVTPTVQIS